MAININTVYQKVLALANKEQRGYITPQEFNLFADQAQMEIFEQYFYDINQAERAIAVSKDYSNTAKLARTMIEEFEFLAVGDNCTIDAKGSFNLDADLPNMYRLGEVSVNYGAGLPGVVCEQVTPKERAIRRMSPLTKSTKKRPIFIKYHDIYNRVKIYPAPPQYRAAKVDYIRKPKRPNWTYVIGGNQNALFNPGVVDITTGVNSVGMQHFELHASEEPKLVIKILQLAGVAIKDFNLAQMAGSKEASTIQQEKQ